MQWAMFPIDKPAFPNTKYQLPVYETTQQPPHPRSLFVSEEFEVEYVRR